MSRKRLPSKGGGWHLLLLPTWRRILKRLPEISSSEAEEFGQLTKESKADFYRRLATVAATRASDKQTSKLLANYDGRFPILKNFGLLELRQDVASLGTSVRDRERIMVILGYYPGEGGKVILSGSQKTGRLEARKAAEEIDAAAIARRKNAPESLPDVKIEKKLTNRREVSVEELNELRRSWRVHPQQRGNKPKQRSATVSRERLRKALAEREIQLRPDE